MAQKQQKVQSVPVPDVPAVAPVAPITPDTPEMLSERNLAFARIASAMSAFLSLKGFGVTVAWRVLASLPSTRAVKATDHRFREVWAPVRQLAANVSVDALKAAGASFEKVATDAGERIRQTVDPENRYTLAISPLTEMPFEVAEAALYSLLEAQHGGIGGTFQAQATKLGIVPSFKVNPDGTEVTLKRNGDALKASWKYPKMSPALRQEVAAIIDGASDAIVAGGPFGIPPALDYRSFGRNVRPRSERYGTFYCPADGADAAASHLKLEETPDRAKLYTVTCVAHSLPLAWTAPVKADESTEDSTKDSAAA